MERFSKPKALRVKANINRSLFYEYHSGFEHRIKDCYNLQDVVEQLIRKGRLAKYITSQRSPRKKRASPMRNKERRNLRHQKTSEPEKAREGQEEDEVVIRTINVIAEDFAGGGMTRTTLKKHL